MDPEKFSYNCCKHCRKMYKYHIDEHCPFDSTMYEWDGIDLTGLYAPAPDNLSFTWYSPPITYVPMVTYMVDLEPSGEEK